MSTLYDPVVREFHERVTPAAEQPAALPEAPAWPSGYTGDHRRHHRRHRRRHFETLAYWLLIVLCSAGICATIWAWSQTSQYKLAQRWHALQAGSRADLQPPR